MTLREQYQHLVTLAEKKGTDKQYRRWVNDQPSCISGNYSEWVNGQGKCEAAHVNRVSWGSGRGKKTPYSCVPLTRIEHKNQHQHGELYYAEPEWWTEQALKYLAAWIAS